MTPTKRLALPLVALCVALVGVVAARNADPTFAEDVAPIVYKNCVSCHRTGGLAPFSLVYYDSATPYLAEMKDAVTNGTMPPWHAEGPRGVFKNDRRLTDAERQLILQWLATGAKPGDKTKLPPKPEFPTGWSIGTPDAIYQMGQPYTVPAKGTVEYMHFEVPTNLTEDKWVQAIEIMPGAREVVHHVIVYARVPQPPGTAAPTPPPAAAPGTQTTPPLFIRNREHGIPPGPPRKDSLHRAPRPIGNIIGATAPGSNALEFPAGAAMRLRPGTVLTFQMHYTTHGVEHKDRSAIGFRFAKDMPNEEIFIGSFTNGSFTIPAGAKDVAIPAELGFGQPVKIWGLLPHTHLRGTRWQYTLDKPDGTKEIILDVPRYDFNWQTFYLFANPLEIAPGSKLNSMAWYDNSASNKSNPDPKVDVKWGDQTWEEMQYTGIIYSRPGQRVRPTGAPDR
jgi:mono/diheme cytochrome c family protein